MKKKFFNAMLQIALTSFSFAAFGQYNLIRTYSGTWTCPPGVTSVTVECWGGGGAGGGSTASTNSQGGGGAGGSYAKSVLTVVPGTVYTVHVGAGGAGSTTTGNGGNGGDTWFNTPSTIFAHGGEGGVAGTSSSLSGAGGVTTDALNIGDIHFKGGNGYAGTSLRSGSGGGSAGSGGNGGDAIDTAGGAAGLNNGAVGCNGVLISQVGTVSVYGPAGRSPGSGGAGGVSRTSSIPPPLAKGPGGNGMIILNYNNVCTASSLPYSQGFNTTDTSAIVCPDCWYQECLTGSMPVQFTTNPLPPAFPAPSEGTKYAFFDSYHFGVPVTRLVSNPVTTMGVSSVDVNFQWYNWVSTNTSSGYGTGVLVQWSLDGITWNDFAGNFIPTFMAGSGASHWSPISLTLPSGAANQPRIFVGFKFSGNGIDQYNNSSWTGGWPMFMDAVNIVSSPIPLPITFEYFKGKQVSEDNNLSLKVNAPNAMAAVLDLEKSEDGKTFTGIQKQTVDAARCLAPFEFTDKDIHTDINFYRIKLQDGDHKAVYSSVVTLVNKSNGFKVLNIVPNPIEKFAALNLFATSAGNLNIVVTDMAGSVLMKQNKNIEKGSNTLNMDFSGLMSGSYLLVAIDNEGHSQTLRLVKK